VHFNTDDHQIDKLIGEDVSGLTFFSHSQVNLADTLAYVLHKRKKTSGFPNNKYIHTQVGGPRSVFLPGQHYNQSQLFQHPNQNQHSF
jgi:hypothetical protein